MTLRHRVAAAACVTVCIGTAHASGGDERESTVTQCKVAVVNPVSGHAECVEPRGAAVDPPPPRPPPAKETCLRHGDLGIKECRRTSQDGSMSEKMEPATPQE